MDKKKREKISENFVLILFGILVVILTGFTYFLVDNFSKDLIKEDFEKRTKTITDQLQVEVQLYSEILYSTRGFFESSDDISRTDFNSYINSISFTQRYDEVSSIFFAEPVAKEETESFLEEIRNDTSVNGVGYPSIMELDTEGLLETNYIISFVEPQEETRLRTLGMLVDTYTDESEAFQALNSNEIVLSNRFPFELTTDDFVFLAFLSVDLPNDEKGLLGLSFRTQEVFGSIVPLIDDQLKFTIYSNEDKSSSSLLYLIDNSQGNTTLLSEQVVSFGDKNWLLSFEAEGDFGADTYEENRALIASSGVFLILILLYGFLYRFYLSRKDALLSLAQTEETFEIIFNESLSFLGLLKPDGEMIEVNETALRFGKVAKDEVIGKKFWDTVWWENDPKNIVQVQQAVKDAEKGKTIFKEMKITGYKQGKKVEVPIEFTLKPIKDSMDHVILLLPTGRDISDVKEYEEELERFKQAVENASDHIVFTDADGTVLYANEACIEITGYDPEEIIGANPSLWGGLMSNEFYENMWKTIKEDKKIYKGKVKNKRKNGEVYDASVIIFPILDSQTQEVEFFVGIERDITEEQEVDRMKTEFVSVASHQLRTPLTGIRWLLELIETNTKLTKEQKQIIEEITINTDRMVTLVNDLLDVSHIETGRKFAIEPTKIKLNLLIDEAVDVNRVKASKKRITLDVKKDEDIEVFVDANKTNEVIANLIDNAIKYSKAEKTVHVATKVYRNNFEVTIRDEGVGIPRTQQSQVFNKFFRADNAVKMQASGSGLGLYIAKSIIEAHGGTITFESEENKGTKFIIKMPIKTVVPKKFLRKDDQSSS